MRAAQRQARGSVQQNAIATLLLPAPQSAVCVDQHSDGDALAADVADDRHTCVRAPLACAKNRARLCFFSALREPVSPGGEACRNGNETFFRAPTSHPPFLFSAVVRSPVPLPPLRHFRFLSRAA